MIHCVILLGFQYELYYDARIYKHQNFISYEYKIKFWYTVASCWIFCTNYPMTHGSTKSTNIKILFLINMKKILIHCVILLDFQYELCYDARIYKHQNFISYKYEIKFWYSVSSCWIFCMNYTTIHGSTNIRILFPINMKWNFGTLCHFVGFPVWITLWCTDLQTSEFYFVWI